MLLRKLWRDLLQNKTQFLSIFLMSFVGMWIFVGLDSESYGAAQAVNAYYQEYNLADLWVQGADFSNEDLNKVLSVKGVQNAERRFLLNGTAELEGNPYLHIGFLNSNSISKLVLTKGEAYKEGKDGIWITGDFAKAKHLKIGDTLSVKIKGLKTESIIRGFIESPEYVYYISDTDMMYPDYTKYGLVFLADTQYPDQTHPVYNQILIDAEDTIDLQVMKEEVEALLDRDDVVVTDRKQNTSYQTFDSEISQHKAMGVMFSTVFLLIALLGIVTTMARVTSNQRTQIGTMKALGFSKWVITRHYVSYGLVISLLGSLLGAWVGYYTFPELILSMFEGVYKVPDLRGAFSGSSALAIVVAVVISTFVSFLACRKELADPPAVTLKPAAPKKIRHSALEKSRFWLMLNFSTQWNLRDVFRNKVRSIMGIVGVTGCTMLMLCAFGCRDAVKGMVDKMYGEILTGENKIMLSSEAGYAAAFDYARQYGGQMVEESAVEFLSDSARKNGMVTIVDNGNYIHFQDETLSNVPLTPNGIALTRKMAQNLNVRQGDFIKWHIIGDDEWQYTRISQIYRDPSIQGIAMTRDTFESLEYTFVPTSVWTNKTVPQSLSDEDEVQAVLNVAEMKSSFQENMEVMNVMIGMMVTGAVILGLVVLYNLGVLSFVEKMREIATLKVLGFKSIKIRGILQTQNIWLTVLGILAGIPIGYGLLLAICSTMSETMDLIPVVSGSSYFYSIGGTFLVSIGVNLMLSGKVKTIDMVDALKGTE
ncbi:MAG: FtsX-like permease family protein [Lachnospiraceae bacterium]